MFFPSPEGSRHVFSTARQTSSSRVWMPSAGGQTITPPVSMDDAITLWAPLRGNEIRKALSSPRLAHYRTSPTSINWLPPSETETMQDYLYRLLVSKRGVTNKAFQRAADFLPVVMEGVRAQNLPPELACLPLVESAFEPDAVSSAGAAGLWQLMPATAQRYGLEVSAEKDERFDVSRATMAATAYLAYLYQYFGDWPLALAAYNCGEGNMQRAVEFTGQRTLEGILHWMAEDSNRSRVLAEETRRFVPSFAAALIAMSESDKLGFSVRPLVPLEYPKNTYSGRIPAPAQTAIRTPLSAAPVPAVFSTQPTAAPGAARQAKPHPASRPQKSSAVPAASHTPGGPSTTQGRIPPASFRTVPHQEAPPQTAQPKQETPPATQARAYTGPSVQGEATRRYEEKTILRPDLSAPAPSSVAAGGKPEQLPPMKTGFSDRETRVAQQPPALSVKAAPPAPASPPPPAPSYASPFPSRDPSAARTPLTLQGTVREQAADTAAPPSSKRVQ